MSEEPQAGAGRHTPRTDVRRLPEKQVDDVAVLHAILDEALVASVGIQVDGQPYVLPMACARDGDHLLLHGSTGSRLMRALAAGTPLCVSVTHLDGLVYARSAFESSMRYRSATVLGVATEVPGEDRLGALEVLTEHLLPGRWAELRAPLAKELAATSVLRVPLAEWSVKVGDGFGDDPVEDLHEPVWAGVVPLRTVLDAAVDAPDLDPGLPVPPHVLDRPAPGRPVTG
jgi:nitroimidazol reductase NimA-like FMN-containing flavoprotein (pyridoxamine 5'-phosphate oxidase superfamily)